MKTAAFLSTVIGFYEENKRDFAWRKTRNPYRILVSEVMLQQTQVERVKGFYSAFLKRFPTVKALDDAPLVQVLSAWKGLGYNRRAANMKKLAGVIAADFKGIFPKNYQMLLALPGIGPSTAGALMNFSYGIPTPFIETNIRSVYLRSFFKGKNGVNDKEILVLIEKHLKIKKKLDCREWFYALYDYGAMLKKTSGNENRRSVHYKKQSTFKGSNRELRSLMLSYLLKHKNAAIAKMTSALKKEELAILKNIIAFEKEGLITRKGSHVTISK